MLARVLNRHQACWGILLSCFHFIMTYRLQKQLGLSNALSKRLYLALKARKATFNQQNITLLKLEWFCLCATFIVMPLDSSFLEQICRTSAMDSLVCNMTQHPNNNN